MPNFQPSKLLRWERHQWQIRLIGYADRFRWNVCLRMRRMVRDRSGLQGLFGKGKPQSVLVMVSGQVLKWLAGKRFQYGGGHDRGLRFRPFAKKRLAQDCRKRDDLFHLLFLDIYIIITNQNRFVEIGFHFKKGEYTVDYQQLEQPENRKIPQPNNLAAKAARRELRRRRLLLRLGLIALAVLLMTILELRVQTLQENPHIRGNNPRDDLGAVALRDTPTSLSALE